MSSGLSGRAEQVLLSDTAGANEEDVARALDNRGPILSKVIGSRHLAAFLEDIKLLFSMLRDHFTRKYTEVPWNTIAASAAALLYILNPLDIIPDFIPGLGYVDDGMVVMLALKMVGRDLVKYRKWRGSES